MTAEDRVVATILAKVAVTNPSALRLAAQLLGVEPCPRCDYRKNKCRCSVVAAVVAAARNVGLDHDG